MKIIKTVNLIGLFISGIIILYWFAARCFPIMPIWYLSVHVFIMCIIAVFALSIGYAAFFHRQYGKIVFLPLLMLICAMLMRNPCIYLHRQVNQYLHHEQREMIVTQLKQAPELIEEYQKQLPKELRGASKHGKIVVLRETPELEVHFFINAGFMPPNWEVVYSSDGELQTEHGNQQICDVEPLGENWYAIRWLTLNANDMIGAGSKELTLWDYVVGY